MTVSPTEPATPGVLMENLTKVYQDLKAVDGINLTVPKGEFLCCLGPNGAGKTTTIKMLTGLIRPTAGRVVVAGYDVQTHPIEAKRRIGDQVCFIGGFDQNRFFTTSTPEETRAEVRRCFREAGAGGGFILSPSDHFFDARPDLLHAFADEARHCTY